MYLLILNHGVFLFKSTILAYREESNGIRVNDTNRLNKVEITITQAKGLNIELTNAPCDKASGKKTITSTKVIAMAVAPISFLPSIEARALFLPKAKCR